MSGSATLKLQPETAVALSCVSQSPMCLCVSNDGKTTRAEAKEAHLSVSAADLNDDGRVTRSESRATRNTKL